MLYFDHNATTPVRPEALEVMAAAARETFGNPSSQHGPGRRARALLEESRERVAALLRVQASEIVFTSGGTEANRLAILGALAGAPDGVVHGIVSAVEHPSVLEVARGLERRGQVRCDFVAPGADGSVDAQDVLRHLREETRWVSLQHANNETGAIQDVAAVGDGCRAKGSGPSTLLHVDAVQSLGKVPLSPAALNADLVSLSSHKIGGPKGTGALWVRSGCGFQAPFTGGPQERRLRPGTENVPAIAAFVRAAELALEAVERPAPACSASASPAAELEALLVGELAGVHVNSAAARRLPNTLNVSFEGVPAELLVIRLDEEGISVSTGSACASGSREPSHVLLAMGISEERAKSAIRFSTGWSTTREEVLEVTRRVARAVNDLRSALA